MLPLSPAHDFLKWHYTTSLTQTAATPLFNELQFDLNMFVAGKAKAYPSLYLFLDVGAKMVHLEWSMALMVKRHDHDWSGLQDMWKLDDEAENTQCTIGLLGGGLQ